MMPVTTWVIVWLVIGSVTVLALIAMMIGLARNAAVLARSAARLQRELAPVAEEINAEAAEAGRVAGSLAEKTPKPRSG
jgi:hypothetical protein